MLLTVYCVRRDLSEVTFSLQVDADFELHNFRALCELESGIPAAESQVRRAASGASPELALPPGASRLPLLLGKAWRGGGAGEEQDGHFSARPRSRRELEPVAAPTRSRGGWGAVLGEEVEDLTAGAPTAAGGARGRPCGPPCHPALRPVLREEPRFGVSSCI